MQAYYAATAVFLLLDLFGGINIRIAFFENAPILKGIYYFACFALGGIMFWRPTLTTLLSVTESLVVVVALTLSMGMRVMTVSSGAIESGGSIVTMEEILNFVISGSIAYSAWVRGMQELRQRP